MGLRASRLRGVGRHKRATTRDDAQSASTTAHRDETMIAQTLSNVARPRVVARARATQKSTAARAQFGAVRGFDPLRCVGDEWATRDANGTRSKTDDDARGDARNDARDARDARNDANGEGRVGGAGGGEGRRGARRAGGRRIATGSRSPHDKIGFGAGRRMRARGRARRRMRIGAAVTAAWTRARGRMNED